MTRRDEPPAGARAENSTTPAGSTPLPGAEWREAVQRVQASYRRTVRGHQYRRRATRGTLPARAGMNRRPPPDDAA